MHFTKEHEWVNADGGEATIGISGYAQEQLGDIVFVELPEIGKELKKGDIAAVVESVKAASEVYAPLSGEVIAVSDALSDDPGLVNREAEDGAWLFRLKLSEPSELEGLMDAAAYQSYLADAD